MKILICENHDIVSVGIKHLLQQLPEVEHVEEAIDGNDVISKLQDSHFDIVLLSVSITGISGLKVLEVIKTKWESVKVLMLNMDHQEPYAIKSFKLGASGYLTNDTNSAELIAAIQTIKSGQIYISSSLAKDIALYLDNETNMPKHDVLSKREYVTMIKLANGKSLQEIGEELTISIKTVSTYRTRLMKKMALKRNTELTRYCMANELIKA